MTPTTILHLIDTTGPGGAETVFTELADKYNADGWRSIAMVRGPGWVADRLQQLGVEVVVEDCKGSFNFGFLGALLRCIKTRQVDLIHSHLLGSNVYASMAGAITRTPVICTFHGSVDISASERFRKIKFGLIRNFSSVVAVSHDLRASIAQQLSLPLNGVELIPNAIDCQAFADAKPATYREDLRIPAETPILGALGNIRAAKAYHVAIQAIAELRNQGQDVVMLIAGHPKEPLHSELLALRDNLGLCNHVHFVGFVADPGAFLASLNVFVLSSDSEGHPLALTQAMATGLPIVATRCGVENLIDERMAWLTERNSPAALAQGISDALLSQHCAHARGKRAQEEAFAKYGSEKMHSRYEALYRHAAGLPH